MNFLFADWALSRYYVLQAVTSDGNADPPWTIAMIPGWCVAPSGFSARHALGLHRLLNPWEDQAASHLRPWILVRSLAVLHYYKW